MNLNPALLPLTYPDLVCVDDLDPMGNETTSDFQTLQQDVYHLLLEEAGSNLDDLSRGIGVESLLNGSQVNIADIQHLIDTELTKDDRISTSSTKVTVADTGIYYIDITITVGSSVIGFNYQFTATGGLTLGS